MLAALVRPANMSDLALLDAVLHVAARTIEVLVEVTCIVGPVERGDEEARIGLALRPLGFGDHPARKRPAIPRFPALQDLEAARRVLGAIALAAGLSQLAADRLHQALVPGQTEDVVDAVVLAPRHQIVAGKARIGPQDDLHVWPAGADLRDDARNLLLGAIGGILVGSPELGGEQVPATEDVERQIAVAVVVAVEVPALLLTVDGIVRGVQVDDHARGALSVGLHTQRHEQRRNRRLVVGDLVIGIAADLGSVLQPVERRLAGQRRTARPLGT